MASQTRGGTRWKRFAVVMVPSVAATAAIGVAMSQGALAASFSVSGQQAKVTAGKLDGQGFVQYGSYEKKVDGKNVPVAVLGFKNAKINNLCQSVVTPDVPLIGTVSLKLTAGTKAGKPVEGKNLYIDTAEADADATFTNINIGVAAGSSSKGPGISPGDHTSKGSFAQEADRAVFSGAKQKIWATTAGTFKLSNLSVRLHKGDNECY
ncbi:cholesterol esterase [Streptomyces sp. A7024]|uniref:Cholesterol esterase n=1 Tax=Streptomyces coryli TaxID=1128680 RepID=A0A6G4U9Z4_9ACTN|nr:DUF6230 family protein [Streptomyces coryli]NGN68953.1 cholesterol esterase [Streptomyces coryli]